MSIPQPPAPPQAAKLLYSVKDAAAALSYSERRVYDWIASGTLPALRIGTGEYRITRRDLDRLVSRLEAEARLRQRRRLEAGR